MNAQVQFRLFSYGSFQAVSNEMRYCRMRCMELGYFRSKISGILLSRSRAFVSQNRFNFFGK